MLNNNSYVTTYLYVIYILYRYEVSFISGYCTNIRLNGSLLYTGLERNKNFANIWTMILLHGLLFSYNMSV